MADVFGRTDQVYGGGLSSDASWMFWGNMPSGGLGLLVTQMSINYQQPIRRIFEIGPWTSINDMIGQPVYYIAGRPEGQLQISRIAGPTAVINGFYKAYGSICNYLNSLFFVSSVGCSKGATITPNSLPQAAFNTVPNVGQGGVAVGGGVPYTPQTTGNGSAFLGWYMNGVIITTLGLTAQSQEMVVAENLQMMFVSLKLYTAPAALNLFPSVPVGLGAGVANAANWTEV